jgi:alkylated DNA repair dioxygenase AlkB
MYRVPPAMQRQFAEYLDRQGVPQRQHVPYQKWLRYYLDYCHKYQLPHQSSNSLPAFINKLVEKRQSLAQRTQAEKAIIAYYALMSGHSAGLSETAESVKKQHHQNKAYINQVSRA